MPRVIGDKAAELLADLPPYERDDPMMQAIMAGLGAELQRVEDAGRAVGLAAIPSQADDIGLLDDRWQARLLSMWESILNLPVAPVGATMADRRDKVTAHIRKRQSGSGADWVENLNEVLGGSSWSYQENSAAYTVTIDIPFEGGGYSAGQALAYARAITPAHIALAATYSAGWLADVSQTDIDAVL